MPEIEEGYCQCGCGEKTTIRKGEPKKFIRGHHARTCHGQKHSQWNGGSFRKGRYTLILMPKHPRANSKGYVMEHTLIAEKAFGKPLPEKAVVHHHTDEQLVICQDNGYHKTLHRRERALRACGNASWRKCVMCKQYDDPANLRIPPTGRAPYHKECVNEYHRQLKITR